MAVGGDWRSDGVRGQKRTYFFFPLEYMFLSPIRLEGPEQFWQPADGVDHRARRLGHTRRLSARQVTKLVSEVVEEGVVEVVGRSWGRAEFI